MAKPPPKPAKPGKTDVMKICCLNLTKTSALSLWTSTTHLDGDASLMGGELYRVCQIAVFCRLFVKLLSPSAKKVHKLWLITMSIITDWTRSAVELIKVASCLRRWLTDRGIQLPAAGLCDFPISITHAGRAHCHQEVLGRSWRSDDESIWSMTSVSFPKSSVCAVLLIAQSQRWRNVSIFTYTK